MYCSSLSTEIIKFDIEHWNWTEKTRKTFKDRPYASAIPTYPASNDSEAWHQLKSSKLETHFLDDIEEGNELTCRCT